MKPDKTIFEELAEDPAAEAAADARAEADVRAGRLISHEGMTRWLKTWGTGKRAPKPTAGD
jgi:predicted transcriptional regulator